MDDTNDSQSVEQPDDRHTLRLRAHVGDRDEFVFHTVAGVTSPDAFRPAELLLLETLHESPHDSVLVPDANYGVVGIVMACFTDQIWMTETSARAAKCCRRNARRNDVSQTTTVALTGDLQALPATFDAAAVAPKAYTPAEVVEQRIADAISTLTDGGSCYVAATPSSGLTRYERTLRELCQEVTTRIEANDCTVVRGTRPPCFDPPRFAEPRTIRPTIGGVTLTLTTYPGLFSAAGLDAGTRALAEWITVGDGDRVLDLACGYGPLGIYAARIADCTVTMTDDDCIATACARKSANLSDVEDSVGVVTADGTSGVRGQRFDRIVCNPPTHAGSSIIDALMSGASELLTGGGVLQMVHHHGVAFDRYLEPYFRVSSTVRSGQYRLVAARPKA